MRRRSGCVLFAALASLIFPHTSAAATLACNSGSIGALLTGISNTTTIINTGIGQVSTSATTAACRVQATIRPLGPSGDSVIRMELWLPIPQVVGQPSPWNGRFLGVGNGGFGGSIQTNLLGQGARFGFPFFDHL